MKSAEIRRSFVDFFAERGHRALPSSPLVPHGDATLLFTNAGMVQFKDYFTGAAAPDFRRAVTVQKCLRVSGKHNDLENVGPPAPPRSSRCSATSPSATTSAEAIEGLGAGRRWGCPAHSSLRSTTGRRAAECGERFRLAPSASALRQKDNWAMGETGPCGPCSEITSIAGRTQRWPGRRAPTGRYLEIWNLVFMQYERAAGGTLTPLPKPSIDTGAGLERVAAVVAGVDSNYDTDLFQPILAGAAALAGTAYGRDAQHDTSLRVIADHLRATAFLLADGVIPTNDGRGYVLRRLLRRAVRHGMRVGFEEPFLCRLLPIVDEAMAGAYPELKATQSASTATIRAEEEKFFDTVAIGSRMVQEGIEEAKRAGRRELSGEQVFRLYDTYGLPIQLLREIAEEERFAVDEAGFEQAIAGQRERSRAATGDSQKRLGALKEVLTRLGPLPPTKFVGYEQLELENVQVLRALRARGDGFEVLEGKDARTREGDEGVLVVDQTPFYAESGGEVGDVGRVSWPGGQAEVVDTQKDGAGAVLHFVRFAEGSFPLYQQLSLAVSASPRRSIQRNHTATHLLHAALRSVLGEGVRQAGSLVAPEHLRFDFTYGKPLTDSERERVEQLVDEWVLRAVPTRITADRDPKEAIAAGAMALFGEKYGDRVRTVEVPGFSLELCGGCHVSNTGEIGPFVLRSERGVASGVRRIEALTGEGALRFLRQRDGELAAVESLLGASAGHAEAELAKLKREIRERDAELARLRVQMVSGAASAAEEQVVEGIRILVREVPTAPPAELRNMADLLRSRLGSGVVVLGTRGEGKVALIAAVTDDLKARVPAGKLLKALAGRIGGSGGGRDDFAQAGGKEPERLPEALAGVAAAVAELVGGGS
jgi:alanyl-tRNA synthetase